MHVLPLAVVRCRMCECMCSTALDSWFVRLLRFVVFGFFFVCVDDYIVGCGE